MDKVKTRVRSDELAKVGRTPGGSRSQQVLQGLGLVNGHAPKNLPAYEAIAGAVPGFAWEVGSVKRKRVERDEATGGKTATPYDQMVVRFQGYPSIHRDAVSLADLAKYARGELTLEFDAFDRATQKRVQPLCDVGKVGEAFARMLVSLPISFPPPEVMQAAAAWLKRAMAGEPSTIFSGVCPDYEVDAEGRYTFNALNDGVGIVAKKVQRALPTVWGFMREHGLNVNFVVAIGDFEADSEEVLQRVKLTRDEFRARLSRSQEAFRAGLHPEMPLQTPFAGDVGDWYATIDAARAEVASGKLSGPYKLEDRDLAQIVKARTSLYERWYGEGIDAEAILRRQIPEYSAMGTIAERAYQNVLVLGGDATVMGIFWQGLAAQIRPVIYLRNVEY